MFELNSLNDTISLFYFLNAIKSVFVFISFLMN